MPKERTSNKPRLAFWLETASQAGCEIAALVGYDAVILDMEHGAIDQRAADRLIPFSTSLGLTVYSRVARAERVEIQHALDSGADGVILPQIRDVKHAAVASGYAKYPPLGTRGVGYSRTMKYDATDDAFFAAENHRVACHVMIETATALADAAAIADLAMVDGLFIGPSDLSMARGRGAVKGSKADQDDVRTIAAAAERAGKVWAMPASDAVMYALARELGADYVTVSDDLTALRTGLEAGLTIARKGDRG